MKRIRNAVFLVMCVTFLSTNASANYPCESFPYGCDCSSCGDGCLEVDCYTVPSCDEAYPDFCDDVEANCHNACEGLVAGYGCDSGFTCYGWCQCELS